VLRAERSVLGGAQALEDRASQLGVEPLARAHQALDLGAAAALAAAHVQEDREHRHDERQPLLDRDAADVG